MQPERHINRITVEFKVQCCVPGRRSIKILIESQWNLKAFRRELLSVLPPDINRITVEFKVAWSIHLFMSAANINRITVEFKGISYGS